MDDFDPNEIEIENEFITEEEEPPEEEEDNDDFAQKMYEKTPEDYHWLLSTISKLCKQAKTPDAFDQINAELRQRNFIPKNYQDSFPTEVPRLASSFNQAYNTIGAIGEGGYGKIIKVQNLIDKQFYALKIVKVSNEDLAVAVREVQCLAALSSPRVVRYFSSWLETSTDESNSSLFIQMQYLSGLTLSDYIIRNMPLPIEEKKNLFKQITLALSEIHSAGIIHRDFTPSNIIVQSDGKIVVIDFGIASLKNTKFCSQHIVPQTTNVGLQPRVGSLTLRHLDQLVLKEADKDTKTLRTVGTPLYSSPKQLAGHKSNVTDDIYSLGIIGYEIFADFKTWVEKAQCIKQLRLNQKLPPEFRVKYNELSDIVEKCVSSDSKVRPSAKEILELPFLKDVKLE